MKQCSHKYIFFTEHNSNWLCQHIALGACAEEQKYINFFQAYWCDLDGSNIGIAIVLILCCIIVFRFLAIAVEEYIAEGVENIANWMGLPENLASVTISCAAISAAEIVTSLVASEMEGGISYNIGSIFGASLFVITIAVGLAIIQTKGKVRLSALVAKRDIVFFIVATLTIVAIAYYKWITWWNSLFLLFLYGCLIISVYFSDFIKKRKLVKLKTLALQNPTNQDFQQRIDDLEGNAHDQRYIETPRSVDSSTRKSVAMALGELMLTIGVHLTETGGLENAENIMLDKEKVEKLADQLDAKLNTIKNFRRKKVTDLNTPEILLKAFDQCFIWILDLTVLPSDSEEYSKTRCIIYPIPGLLFIALYFEPELNLKHVLMLVIAGLVISIVFSIVLKEKEPPKWFPVLNVLGIGSALIWTDLLVEILIDMVKFLGVRYNLSNAYMGLTVIAAGRAVPDLVTTLVLCRHCDKLSIVSSVYVAQVFNLIFGFGLAMLRLCILKGPQPFDLFEESKLFKNAAEIIVIIVTLIVLIATGIHLITKRHKMRLYFAYGLIWTYVIFFAGVTYIAFVNSFSK